MADAMDEMFDSMEEEAANKAKHGNSDKCLDRLSGSFARVLHVVPAKGNIRLSRLISKPQSVEALQDIISAVSDVGGLIIAPLRVLNSGRGVRWIACIERPIRVPRDCVVVTVALGGKLIRVVPEQNFIDFWSDDDNSHE